MKKLAYLSLLLATPAFAQTSSINNNVDWNAVSTTPSVNTEVIMQDFQPVDANQQATSFVQDELTNFDFLTQTIDERVFYTFDAKIRVLDKYTDNITDYDITETKPADLGKFNIQVKSCANVLINNVENQLAFVQVLKNEQPVFNGWMSNINKNFNFPELAQIYLNLLECKKAERPTVTLEETEQSTDQTQETTQE